MFADISVSDLTYPGSLVTAIGALVLAVRYLFGLYRESRDRELAAKDKENARLLSDMEGLKKSYAEIALEAVKSAADTTNFYRAKMGLPPLPMAPPVVSESHSPSTHEQREAANIATLRATLANIKKYEGQAPRAEPEKALTQPNMSDAALAVRIATERTMAPLSTIEQQIEEVKTSVEEVKMGVKKVPGETAKLLDPNQPRPEK